MRDVFVRVVTEDYREVIAAIECPVDLVWGADDTETPLEVAERAVGLFPSASLTVLPGVGHFTPTEAPDALAAAIARTSIGTVEGRGATTDTDDPASPLGGRWSGGAR
jgi:pimeloyl-ACP methyl ester carboxylesterase